MSDENKTPQMSAIPEGLTEEEKQRLEKYSKLEQSKGKRVAIVVSVTAFLILLFVGGVVGGMIYLSNYEAPQPLPDTRSYYSVLPGAPEEILAELKTIIPPESAKNSVKVKVDESVGINEEFTVASGNETLKNEISMIREDVAKTLSASVTADAEQKAPVYGDPLNEKLPSLDFDPLKAEKVTCADEPDKDNQSILWRNFTFDFGSRDFSDALADDSLSVFCLQEAQTEFLKFKETVSTMLTVNNVNIHCDSLVISARADSFTGTLDRVILKKVYTITADISFTGDYAAAGGDTLTFTVEASKSYSFLHAGVNISKDVIFTEKGKSDEIIRTVSSDETHDKVVVTWSSSAPDILSVDEKGYFKAHKISDKPVKVTATYNYLGTDYTDECTVYVREPVDSVKVNENKLSLAVGEKHTIGAVIKPKNATLTEMYWFSEDESIATVDKATGEITAVSAGNVKIYCITLDGNFKDSCELTVTG